GVHGVAGGAVDVGPGADAEQKGDLIDALRQVLEDAGDPAAGLTVLGEGEGAAEDLAGDGGDGLDALVAAGVEGLAVLLLQSRLVVEGVHLAGAAVHEQLDDAACFGAMMDAAVQVGGRGGAVGVGGEEVGQGDAAEAAAYVPEEGTTVKGVGHWSSPQEPEASATGFLYVSLCP